MFSENDNASTSTVFLASYPAGMESSITLVDRGSYGEPSSVISFARDDMKNTTIHAVSSTTGNIEPLLYRVQTDTISNTQTNVYRGETGDVVAVLQRREMRPDTLQFVGQPVRKLKEWLHGKDGKWKDFPVSFEWDGTSYTWKANNAKQIALHNGDDEVVAWFQSSYKTRLTGASFISRALVALQPEGQRILDAVVVSLLIVEYELRMKEKKYHCSVTRHGQ